MFRAFVSRTINSCSISNRTGAALQFARFNSEIPMRTRAKEIRDVQLIGTVYQQPLILEDGMKVITVKTVNPDGHYKLHRATIRSPKILELVQNNLSIGQRVYIAGELRASNFVNQDNQNRQMYQVHVKELYVSKITENNDSEPIKHSDCNNVNILAHIASEIQHNENSSRFYVSTHFMARNPENDQTGSETVSFFNIFVHDPDLINVVKQQLQKKDRIFIKGLLGYKPETDQNGRKKFSGHIEAENILKIDRFSEAAIENPVEFSN